MNDKSILRKRGKHIVFLLLPLAAGIAIALQNVFYDKVGEDVGVMGTVVVVHFFGLLAALFVYLLTKGTYSNLSSNFSLYMVICGVLGVIVVSGITKSVSANGLLLTIMLSILAQIVFGKIIAHFGWFGVPQVSINWMQILGIVVMISGVFIYQKS